VLQQVFEIYLFNYLFDNSVNVDTKYIHKPAMNPSVIFLDEERRETITTKMSTQYAGNIFFHATKKKCVFKLPGKAYI